MLFDSFNMNISDFGELHQKKNAIIIKSKFMGWDIQTQDKKKFVNYKIKLMNVLFKYSIQKRYSDFDKFHQELINEYPQIEWPNLPSKFFIQNYDPEKL
jgi:hypothetical protein